MFCPIKHLSLKDSPTDQCNPNCAWAIKKACGVYACSVAVMATECLPSDPKPLTPVYNVQEMPGRYGRP